MQVGHKHLPIPLPIKDTLNFSLQFVSWDQIWREECNGSTQHETKKLQKIPFAYEHMDNCDN